MPDQERRAHDSESDLQAALQTLLQANLGDQVLRSQDRTLLGARKCATAQSTTDEVTDHPGHQ